MEAMDAILGRRSIRKYTSDAVTDTQVKQLLEAGMAAPSAGNQRPWHFVVIDDRAILDRIPDIHPYAQMIKEAPVAILVCADTGKLVYEHHWPHDCSAATLNILLAAHAIGLGSVWLGVYPDKDRVKGLAKLLNLPKNAVPFSLLPVGVPDENKLASKRYDESRVHNNLEWR